MSKGVDSGDRGVRLQVAHHSHHVVVHGSSVLAWSVSFQGPSRGNNGISSIDCLLVQLVVAFDDVCCGDSVRGEDVPQGLRYSAGMSKGDHL